MRIEDVGNKQGGAFSVQVIRNGRTGSLGEFAGRDSFDPLKPVTKSVVHQQETKPANTAPSLAKNPIGKTDPETLALPVKSSDLKEAAATLGAGTVVCIGSSVGAGIIAGNAATVTVANMSTNALLTAAGVSHAADFSAKVAGVAAGKTAIISGAAGSAAGVSLGVASGAIVAGHAIYNGHNLYRNEHLEGKKVLGRVTVENVLAGAAAAAAAAVVAKVVVGAIVTVAAGVVAWPVVVGAIAGGIVFGGLYALGNWGMKKLGKKYGWFRTPREQIQDRIADIRGRTNYLEDQDGPALNQLEERLNELTQQQQRSFLSPDEHKGLRWGGKLKAAVWRSSGQKAAQATNVEELKKLLTRLDEEFTREPEGHLEKQRERAKVAWAQFENEVARIEQVFGKESVITQGAKGLLAQIPKGSLPTEAQKQALEGFKQAADLWGGIKNAQEETGLKVGNANTDLMEQTDSLRSKADTLVKQKALRIALQAHAAVKETIDDLNDLNEEKPFHSAWRQPGSPETVNLAAFQKWVQIHKEAYERVARKAEANRQIFDAARKTIEEGENADNLFAFAESLSLAVEDEKTRKDLYELRDALKEKITLENGGEKLIQNDFDAIAACAQYAANQEAVIADLEARAKSINRSVDTKGAREQLKVISAAQNAASKKKTVENFGDQIWKFGNFRVDAEMGELRLREAVNNARAQLHKLEIAKLRESQKALGLENSKLSVAIDAVQKVNNELQKSVQELEKLREDKRWGKLKLAEDKSFEETERQNVLAVEQNLKKYQEALVEAKRQNLRSEMDSLMKYWREVESKWNVGLLEQYVSRANDISREYADLLSEINKRTLSVGQKMASDRVKHIQTRELEIRDVYSEWRKVRDRADVSLTKKYIDRLKKIQEKCQHVGDVRGIEEVKTTILLVEFNLNKSPAHLEATTAALIARSAGDVSGEEKAGLIQQITDELNKRRGLRQSDESFRQQTQQLEVLRKALIESGKKAATGSGSSTPQTEPVTEAAQVQSKTAAKKAERDKRAEKRALVADKQVALAKQQEAEIGAPVQTKRVNRFANLKDETLRVERRRLHEQIAELKAKVAQAEQTRVALEQVAEEETQQRAVMVAEEQRQRLDAWKDKAFGVLQAHQTEEWFKIWHESVDEYHQIAQQAFQSELATRAASGMAALNREAMNKQVISERDALMRAEAGEQEQIARQFRNESAELITRQSIFAENESARKQLQAEMLNEQESVLRKLATNFEDQERVRIAGELTRNVEPEKNFNGAIDQAIDDIINLQSASGIPDSEDNLELARKVYQQVLTSFSSWKKEADTKGAASADEIMSLGDNPAEKLKSLLDAIQSMGKDKILITKEAIWGKIAEHYKNKVNQFAGTKEQWEQLNRQIDDVLQLKEKCENLLLSKLGQSIRCLEDLKKEIEKIIKGFDISKLVENAQAMKAERERFFAEELGSKPPQPEEQKQRYLNRLIAEDYCYQRLIELERVGRTSAKRVFEGKDAEQLAFFKAQRQQIKNLAQAAGLESARVSGIIVNVNDEEDEVKKEMDFKKEGDNAPKSVDDFVQALMNLKKKSEAGA